MNDMKIIEEVKSLSMRKKELEEQLRDNSEELEDKSEDTAIAIGNKIVEMCFLWDHEWVLFIHTDYKGDKEIILRSDSLNPELSSYIKEIEDAGIYWWCLCKRYKDDFPLKDTGWLLHFHQRGNRGMSLKYSIDKNTDVKMVLRLLDPIIKTCRIKTGKLRHKYYEMRRTVFRYEEIIKGVEELRDNF